ncbi:MAG: hypothetical protein ACK4ZW_03320 [Blastomonas sp.]
MDGANIVKLYRAAPFAVLGFIALFSATETRAQPTSYPVYCQGISVGAEGNSMFLSSGFFYPLSTPPEGYLIADPELAAEFARQVKNQTGKAVLGQTCFTRQTAQELQELINSTRTSNGSNWTLVDVAWAPSGSYPLTSSPADLTSGNGSARPAIAAPSTASGPRTRDDDRVAAELRQAEQAARAAAAAQAEAERRLAIAKADEELRAVNAQQAQIAEEQLRKNAEEQRKFEEKQRVYEERQRAFATAEARYQADVKAAAEARKKWEADVAACLAGDTTRCAPAPQQ